MALLTIDDHPAIRAAIDVAVTPRDLPDDTIAEEIFREAASLAVEEQVPDWATLTGVLAARVRKAAIYTCAALLCEITPIYTTESVGRWSGTRAALDPAARAQRLRTMAQTEIDAIMFPGKGYPTLPLIIAGRGRWESETGWTRRWPR